MERKNTMLLTVIAVATLLVAVVGATFAYYSVTGTNRTSTNALKTTTEKVGTVTLTQGEDELFLKISTDQMAKKIAGTKYYSTTTDIYATPTTSTSHDIATFELTGATKGAKYECTFDYSIASENLAAAPEAGQEESQAYKAYAALTAADGNIYFNKSNNVAKLFNTTYTLKDTQTAITGKGQVNLTANDQGKDTATITGYAEFINTDDKTAGDDTGKQNRIAELNMKTTISITNFSCDTTDSFTE